MIVPTTRKTAMTPASRQVSSRKVEHARLDGNGAQGQEIIAGEGRVPGVEEMGAEQQYEHQRAEQAGPALLETEQQEFVDPALWARPGLEGLEARADASEACRVWR